MLVLPVEKRIDWKRPPIVLIALVLVNFIVFAFYQSDDRQHSIDATNTYLDSDLLDIEWQAFNAYVRDKKLAYKLDKANPSIAWRMATDDQFGQFVKAQKRYYINSNHERKWRLARQAVEVYSSKISHNAFALNVQNIKIVQLFSHQFLHGDFMHLLGNMVFLILTGFAVEAAIGSLRFLSYYLLSGLGSGLLFALLAEPASSGLVGASGAISGVMAMYVMLFRNKKIQFFYWFFVFTGYFRAAAIIMLPLYIGYELFNYFTNTDSNVAYTAHIGGFIVGAALIYATQSINNVAIDEDYLEGEKDDTTEQAIQKIYALIAQCNFRQAWKSLKFLKQAQPNKAELVEVEYNLIKALHPKKRNEYLLHRMDKSGNSKALLIAQLQLWKQYTETQKQQLSFAKKAQLLQSALELDKLNDAENIFESTLVEINNDNVNHDNTETRMQCAILARRIAAYCQSNERHEKSSKYSNLADSTIAFNGSISEAIQ
jgi:membrane associated rhomboid family serine protease